MSYWAVWDTNDCYNTSDKLMSLLNTRSVYIPKFMAGRKYTKILIRVFGLQKCGWLEFCYIIVQNSN